jgi:hypothetical protein
LERTYEQALIASGVDKASWTVYKEADSLAPNLQNLKVVAERKGVWSMEIIDGNGWGKDWVVEGECPVSGDIYAESRSANLCWAL